MMVDSCFSLRRGSSFGKSLARRVFDHLTSQTVPPSFGCSVPLGALLLMPILPIILAHPRGTNDAEKTLSNVTNNISLTKLASLLVKTLAKPLSARIKHEFSRTEPTKRLLISVGQTNHRITSRMTIWSSGYKVRNISPLEEDKALKDGADFIGESFVFLVSGGLVIWEYNRSSEANKERQEKKRLAIKAEQAVLKAKLKALDVRLRALEDAVRAQSDTLLGIAAIGGGKLKYVAPPPQQLVPIDDDDDKEEEEVEKHQGEDSTAESSSPPSEKKPWWKIL
jgi:optic atrophy 3 protein